MDEPTVPFGEPELWRVSAFQRALENATDSSRYNSLSPSLLADLQRFEHDNGGAEVLEVLAACLRHSNDLALHLDRDGHVLPITVFPRQHLFHTPLPLDQLYATRFDSVRLLQVERASLDEVLKDSITLAEGKMRRGAVSIDTVIEPDVPELLADPHQLRQLYSNLLANAFEALGGEGHVDIRAWLLPGEEEPVGSTDPQPPQVVVEVRDSGPGIGPDDMERIFSPFFSTKPQGTGLGLAIVRKVVDAHDGHIDAISARGRGATFRVTLPVVPSERSLGR